MNPEQVHADTKIVPRLLVGLVTVVCRHPWLVLTAALVTCALSTYASYTRLEYRTQRSDLVSPDKDYQQRWRQYLAEFGDDDDMVVVVQGADRRQMERALDSLAAEVQKQPALFDRLFYKVDLHRLCNRALLFLPADQIRLIQDNLKSMDLLLRPLPVVGVLDPYLGWKELTLLSLLQEARGRAAKLKPGMPLTPADDQFFTQLRSISRTATATLTDPAGYHNPWQSLLAQPSGQDDLLAKPQYFFSGDGSLAFLLVRPVKEGGSFTPASKSVAALRDIVAATRPAFPGLEFGLTGLPVLENDEMVASQNDTNVAGWLALAGVVTLYLIFFRSIRFTLLSMATLLIGTGWASGWMILTVGHLNILSATFAVMLIGMGDYAVLWVTRYDADRRSGADVRTAMRRTAASVGPGILTAGTATAIAFFAAMLADFQAVAELGWIAGCGVMLCVLATFTIAPALLCITDRRWGVSRLQLFRPVTAYRVFGGPDQEAPPTEVNRPWLPGLARRPRWVISVSLAVVLVLSIAACRISYDHNLLHLQARGLDSVKWELTLIDHTAGASWHALSYTSTPEEALALKARYEKLPEVSRVVEVASLVPPDQESKLGQLRDIQRRLRYLPRRGSVVQHQRPSLSALHQTLAGLIQSLAERAGTQPLLTELSQSLAALEAQLDRTSPDEAGARLRELDNHLTSDLTEDLYRLRDVSTPAPITVADLPPDLRERYIGKNGKWLLRVFGKDCLWDYAPLAHFVEQIRTVDPEATGKPFGTLEGLKAMKSGFQWAALYAFGAIVVALLLDFRTLKRILLALVPLALGILVSLGIMSLCGLPLNPANMIAFPLILGVGVDNGVMVLHDYLRRRRQGTYSLSHVIGQGTLLSALATMVGFGTLMLSQHRGLFELGFILTLGVTCCMLASLIFLPAVLRLLNARTPAKVAPQAAPAPEPEPIRMAA
jgi:hopanoid biosynthesis associated RND transporter like protein HpnN